jgi:ligand-binding SRPBCC domain-containing protein
MVTIKRDQAGHRLDARMVLPRPIDEVFAFFSDAANLERLTPDWLQFVIVTPTPIELGEGAVIDYRLRLHRVPLRWRTLISAWEPPHRFVDRQTSGPYARWVHEHRFADLDGATLCADSVSYRMHGGRAAHELQNATVAARDLCRIFSYRQQQMALILG